MNITRIHWLAALAFLFSVPCISFAAGNKTQNFDSAWRFLKADATGAEQPSFKDSAWRKLDLPHDWSIEGPFAETNLTGGAGAFMPSGIAWYRKHFSLPAVSAGDVVSIQFDGVMQNSDVWINGFHLGHRPYGYTSFCYELTGHLNFGGDNVIAVRADTSAQPASRWYSGAGIYRHVWLMMTGPIHITEHGVFISTSEVSAKQAAVKVEIAVTNGMDSSQKIKVQTKIFTSAGKCAYVSEMVESLPQKGSDKIAQDLTLQKPELWSLDDPKLYCAVTQISVDDKIMEQQTNTFGIRDAHFEPDTGFWLNGKNFKLNGVCLHADGGAFGAATPLDVWEARLKTLKSLGANAIRTAHNPPAPEFLDLCDRMGFLVMDEMFDCWTVAKNPYDYHLYFDEWSQIDERDAIMRDRNHPSVILYSVGNEIHDTPQAEKAKRILTGLVQVAHEADPSRPVTQALFRPNVSHDYDDGLADLLDVVGQNYRPNEILAAHTQKPARKIVGTENTHDRIQWTSVRDNAPYSGEFIWTGIDYLGESRRWPMIGHGSGLLDRTGVIRPLARERQSWWTDAPMVTITRRVAATDLMPTDPGYGQEERHTQVIYADWTPHDLAPHTENVEVYSNCKQVELFLNGKSLGKEPIHADASPRNWQVPFSPGVLSAIASDNDGKPLATDELHTAGVPMKIVLTTDAESLSADWNGVATVRAIIEDADGVQIPRASDLISFKVSGPGLIAAVDNGDNASQEPFQAKSRHAYQGECAAFIKATTSYGDIKLTASAPGLASGTIRIHTAK